MTGAAPDLEDIEPLRGVSEEIVPANQALVSAAREGTFHRDHSTLAQGGGQSFNLRGDTFFRIVDSVTSYHYQTVQGSPLKKGSFSIQEYIAVGPADSHAVEISPKGAPRLATFSKVPLNDLVAGLRFWRIGHTRYIQPPTLPIPVGVLMVEMATNRCVQGITNQTSYIDLLPSPQMQVLLDGGKVLEVEGMPCHYQLTPDGLSSLVLFQSIVLHGTALSFARQQDWNPAEATKWELMIYLSQHGWIDEVASGHVEPKQRNSRRIYYTRAGDLRLPHPYLMCLYMSDRLFEQGLESLHHFQANQYYTTLRFLLDKCPSLLSQLAPNQPRQYYVDFRHRAEHPGHQAPRLQPQPQQPQQPRRSQLEADDGLSAVSAAVVSGQAGTHQRARGQSRGQKGRGRSSGRSKGRGSGGRAKTIPANGSDAELTGSESESGFEGGDVAGSAMAAAMDDVDGVVAMAESAMPPPAVAPVASRATSGFRPEPSGRMQEAVALGLVPRSFITQRTTSLAETTVFFGPVALIKRVDQGATRAKLVSCWLVGC